MSTIRDKSNISVASIVVEMRAYLSEKISRSLGSETAPEAVVFTSLMFDFRDDFNQWLDDELSDDELDKRMNISLMLVTAVETFRAEGLDLISQYNAKSSNAIAQ